MSTLRFGFIGAGGITHGHARRLRDTGEAEIVAIAEPVRAAADRFSQQLGLQPAVYTDYAEMLRRERLDCVLIASPHTLHYEQSVAALRAGCHVLSEKPMVCSIREARSLVNVIRETDKIFMISYQRHLEPVFLWMKQQIESGSLGPIHYIAAVSCQEWLQLTAGTWRQDPGLSGGGQINDTGSHFIDMLTWLGGPVETVEALMDNRGTRVDINSALIFRFRNGILGALTVIGDAHSWWEDWTISGEEGTVYLRNGRVFKAVLRQGVREVPREELPGAPGDVDRAFIDAVRGRAPVLVPASIGLGVIELTEAAWRSAAEQRPVRVDELTAN